MVWLKSSDTAAQHPIVLAPLTWPSEELEGLEPLELATLLYGLAHRCATYSAQYTTDYVISVGVVAMNIGARWEHRAAQVERAGYWSRVEGGYLLVDDAEHLFHIRRRKEIEWEKARRRDVANPVLTVPVRLRDGDGCRYCGAIVQWHARRGGRKGTYDHRIPGQPARTPDDLVVSCGMCNSTRGNDPDALELLPTPVAPYYTPQSVEFLAGHGYTVPEGTSERPANQAGDKRPRGQRDHAQSDHAASVTTPESRTHPGWRGVYEPPLPLPDLQKSADPADRGYAEVRNPGRVRGGSGDGSGRARARRGRRGGRAH